jgi:hypothetical protein
MHCYGMSIVLLSFSSLCRSTGYCPSEVPKLQAFILQVVRVCWEKIASDIILCADSLTP